jgi:hypothetical protein
VTPQPPEAPKPARKITPLWKRLPLIVIGLFGIWLWQGGAGIVSVEHTVVWKVPGAYASVRKVEAQLWQGEDLLTRVELETPAGLTADPERRLTLKNGRYRSELLVWREGAAAVEVKRTDVEVGSEPVIVIR